MYRAIEFGMGGPRQRWVVVIGCVGGRILEIPVRIIFNNDDVELDTNGIYLFAALNAQRSTCGVLTNARLNVSSVVHVLQEVISYVTV